MRLRIPPAVLFAGAVAAQRIAPGKPRRTPVTTAVSAAIACASAALAAGSFRQFARRRTTVDPVNPESASALVVTGPNAHTRNPMYAGMLGCLIAHAVARRSAVALLPAAGFYWAIDRFQIPREERALLESFGSEYQAYCAAVPRWLSTMQECGNAVTICVREPLV